MTMKSVHVGFASVFALGVWILHAPHQMALAQTPAAKPAPKTIASFSVGGDQSLIYPSDLITLPDEHTTFIPPPPGAPTNRYLVFGASSITGGGNAGTVVLQTTDFTNFTYAAGYSSPVMQPPIPFMSCNTTYDQEFDENYSAPGSVVQDPSRPPGHFIMIYEAENHCPGGTWQRQFYATVGFARSHDFGKTWPAPIPLEFGGIGRRPVLKSSIPEPATHQSNPVYIGNATPSAFVDVRKNGAFLYAIYSLVGPNADGFLRVGRTRLDGDYERFHKWYEGGWSQPGLGGLDTGVTPSKGGTCNGDQRTRQISYNDALGQYLMTFVCVSYKGQPAAPYQAAWFYATATDLDKQDWTAPQMITGSQFPVTPACASDQSGASFDGWYPSFVTPGALAGHTGATGLVFFMNGCNTGLTRQFMSRTFTITTN